MIPQISCVTKIRPPAARIIEELVKINFFRRNPGRAFTLLVTDINRRNALNGQALKRIGGQLIKPDSVLDIVQNVRSYLSLLVIVRLARKCLRISPAALLHPAQEVYLPLDPVHGHNRLTATLQDFLFALIPLRIVVVVIPVPITVSETARFIVRIFSLTYPFFENCKALALKTGFARRVWIDGRSVFLGLRRSGYNRHDPSPVFCAER